MYCRNCGAELGNNDVFCHKCGSKVGNEDTAKQKSDPKTVHMEQNTVKPLEREAVKIKSADSAVEAKQQDIFQTKYTNTDKEREKSGSSDACKTKYGENIKPYYCEQFDRIASGQKPKFNWAAFLFGGWNQLYNGCTRIFCRTYLPLFICISVVYTVSMLSVSQFNSTMMGFSTVLSIIISCASFVLTLVNGFKFNKWYYQDVTRDPYKQRSRKGLWILFISMAVYFIFIRVLLHMITPSYDDLFEDFSQDDLLYKQAENVELAETYTNEKEGFSFQYPSSWQHLNATDFAVRKEMLGADSLILEIYSTDDLTSGESYFASYMQVLKGAVNSTFQGTMDDFQQSLSAIMDEVEVIELSDIELDGIPARKLSYLFNDSGQTCVVIEYYYVIDDIMYVIRFYTYKGNFDKYEAVFDAIIESYTITAVNTSVGTADDSVFGEALIQLIMYNTLPDGSIANDLDGKTDGLYDQFAICDINQDGKKELLINISSGSTASSGVYIYEVNTAHTGLEYVWSFYADVAFFEAGIVKEDWSHNQGLANNFWPYSIYRRTNEGYSAIGSVDAWEKAYMQFDFSGNSFPDEVDLNGNGIVYFIGGENGIDYENPVDDAEYKEFEKRLFGGAEELYVPWQSLELYNVKAATGIEEEIESNNFSDDSLFLYSGSYEGINQTSISVSIYSSFDEGNIVGNIRLYDSYGQETFALIRDDYMGNGIYTLCLEDSRNMYIGFYQGYYGEYYADIQGLDAIYTNVNEVETYTMTEQYIP